MPHDRFFTPQNLHHGEIIELEDEESYHLQKVMRKRTGDLVEVVNGKGLLATAKVQNAGFLEIQNVITLPLLPLQLSLALALTMPSHLEWAIEKGTEIGVAHFILFPGDKSQKSDLSANQKTRLAKITIAAMKQSGRGTLPTIEMLPEIRKWTPFSDPLFFGDIGTDEMKTPPKEGRLIFAIGPEGGWSEQERVTLKALGGNPFSLNPNILRAETAAVVAAALLLH